MRVRVLLPDARALGLDRVKIDAANRTVRIDVRSMASAGVCPKCGLKSRRIHSKYQRQLNDLPWQDLCVKVMWRSRKFFCKTEDCAQRIFTERLPVVAQPHARRTTRLMMALRCIAFACGGEEGSRLAERLSITISPDSLLRLIRKTTIPPRLTPRVLRVDDWAFKKGKRYDTILVDLERGRPVDLLPERSADSLKRWLEEHDGVEIISRDRGDCYIKRATEGAPGAIQVADRFHLVQNLRDALGRLLDRQAKSVLAAVQQSNEARIKPQPVAHKSFRDADDENANSNGTRTVAEKKR